MAKGRLGEARQTAKAMTDEEIKNRCLHEVFKAEIAEGWLDDARQTAEAMNHEMTDDDLREVFEAQMAKGSLNKARQTAEEMTDWFDKWLPIK